MRFMMTTVNFLLLGASLYLAALFALTMKAGMFQPHPLAYASVTLVFMLPFICGVCVGLQFLKVREKTKTKALFVPGLVSFLLMAIYICSGPFLFMLRQAARLTDG